jgi:hypothetical protein
VPSVCVGPGQTTFDRVRLGMQWQQWGVVTSRQLSRFLWAPGPTVYSLGAVLIMGKLPRYAL